MIRGSNFGVVMVIILVAVTLYMAFAFPYTLLHLKQTETTEIKAVIIVARGGDKSPKPDSYFTGEEPPEELNTIGFDQLTNEGKQRMFSLGKFLKLRYYHNLLNGNPRKVYIRSSDLDRSLESAQALLAGLNPPKNRWLWSTTNELNNWQPKAIHTTTLNSDDMLSDEPNCFRLDTATAKWKNSTRYQQLLSEFRHDLQTLRSNTGLDFEDDLEMLADVEDALTTRKAYNSNVPPWYTNTFANRLAHIADVAAESRYSSANSQRLFVGRLLHEISENVNTKIRLHQLSLASAPEHLTGEVLGGASDDIEPADRDISLLREQRQQEQQKLRQQTKLRVQNTPNFFVYMTHKNRLSALLNSLQIYTSQPHFGSILLIELHYDPINQLYFLRLFTVSPTNPDIFPEPLRVNPIACADSGECSPQQFEQNIRHLMLDKLSWQEACMPGLGPSPIAPTIAPPRPMPLIPTEEPYLITQRPNTEPTTTTVTTTTVTTSAYNPETTTLSRLEEKLDETLIVGDSSDSKSVPPGSSNSEGATDQPSTGTSNEPVTEPSMADEITTKPISPVASSHDTLTSNRRRTTHDIYFPDFHRSFELENYE